MWIARDKNGSIWLYESKPTKFENHWAVDDNRPCIILNKNLFPEVKWKDKEPKEVELKIKENAKR